MKNVPSAVLLAGLFLLPLRGEIKARITYDRGVSVEVVNPAARDQAVLLPQGALPFSRITRMDFDFGPELTLEKSRDLFHKGEFDALGKLLDPVLQRTAPFAEVPGDLDEFLFLQMKLQFWNGHYAAMSATGELLRRRNSPFADPGSLYDVLAQIEQGKTAEAAAVFQAMGRPDAVSAPMALFIRARLAMTDRNYREAHQHLARMIVLHSRDPEWMPAATLYEGLSYKRTGYLEAARNISNELRERYSGGYWSRRAEELK